MHSALTRLQNVFGFFTTVATFVALAIAVTSLVTTPTPQLKEGALALKNVQVVKGRPHYYSNKKEEYAHIKFDLDVDLTTLFTWNTKQIFLYITASYPPPPSSTHSEKNPPPPHSTAIIWDAILPHSHSPAHENHYIYPNPKKSAKSAKGKGKVEEKGKQHPGILKLAGQRPKYQITDPSGRVASRANATLELHYNIQPWVGALTWGSPRAATPGAGAGARQQGASQQGEGLFGILSLQRYFPALGAKTPSFNFPALKDRSDAAKSAGSDGLGVASGKEKNRGSPA